MTVASLQDAEIDWVPANVEDGRVVFEFESEVCQQVVVHDVKYPKYHEDSKYDGDNLWLHALGLDLSLELLGPTEAFILLEIIFHEEHIADDDRDSDWESEQQFEYFEDRH